MPGIQSRLPTQIRTRGSGTGTIKDPSITWIWELGDGTTFYNEDHEAIAKYALSWESDVPTLHCNSPENDKLYMQEIAKANSRYEYKVVASIFKRALWETAPDILPELMKEKGWDGNTTIHPIDAFKYTMTCSSKWARRVVETLPFDSPELADRLCTVGLILGNIALQGMRTWMEFMLNVTREVL